MPTATNILLEKGEDYWVRLAPNTILPATAGWDMLNVSNVAGAVLTHTGTGTNYYNTRSMPLIVEGTAAISAVPIPGAVWLMGSALIGFVGWGRRTVVA